MGKQSSNDKHHVTETPDVSHIKNLDVTYEHSDISIGGVVKFIVALVVLGVVVHLLMWGMFRVLNTEEDKLDRSPGPMALSETERLPPEPRLQAAKGYAVEGQNLELREPEAEFRVVQEKWRDALELGPVNEKGQRIGMPIEEAKKKILEGGGLPVRGQPQDSKQDSKQGAIGK